MTFGRYYKSFTVIIYRGNDSKIIIYERNVCGHYYKTKILANLALARGA